MRDALRAGIAIYNDGYYHAAHDAWEAHWLDLEAGTDDERLLHGLIQFTATIHHARNRNWTGATGLAASAHEYLEDLPAEYRRIDVAAVRRSLRTLASDPEVIERRRPPALEHAGAALELADLDLEATFLAAGVLAEEFGYDETVLEDAVAFARADLEAERATSRFLALVQDFVRESADRALVYDRLSAHVERRRAKRRDVEGLFDPDL
ncbi:DUF309 domain-containing protein [Natronosalvus caseinilyticus]|uniref:DUF309 domain-containing protein n=1 Tax=Natronosalvus caseinilyticus TaxID=2953747 RepID=UPI0028AD4A1A|nr:DUF309 domain-containing protein [Natronosalvus caseinilyticus]